MSKAAAENYIGAAGYALDDADERLTAAVTALGHAKQALADWPDAPPPPPPAAVPDVRDLFDHGGEWGTRARWELLMGRAPRRRSIWLAGGSEAGQLASMADVVTGIVNDTSGTVYVIGVSPFPGAVVGGTSRAPRTTHYERLLREASRIPLARRRNVVWRFGWEFDGDWYPHSIFPKGSNDPRWAPEFITATREFARMRDAWCPGTRIALNSSGGSQVTAKVAGTQRVLDGVRDVIDLFSVDFYPMWDFKSTPKVIAMLEGHIWRATAAGLPWAVDEWSPYVDKVTGGVQRGLQDTPAAVEQLFQVVQFVQAQAAAGRAPEYVQVFDREVVPEGHFSVIGAVPPTGVGGMVYDVKGAQQRVYPPRVASMFISLLGRRTA